MPTRSSWLHRFLLLLLALLACAPAVAQLRLQESGRTSLTGHFDLLRDDDSTLSIQALSQPEVAARFVPQAGALRLGYYAGSAWLRIRVTRPATAPAVWWLELKSPFLDQATLYFPQADGRYQVRQAGDALPLAGRDLDYRSPVFRLELPADTPTTFYLRVRGRNALSFGMELWTPERFASALALEQLAFGLFFAVHLVLILSNLWFFQATRDWSYGLFSIFTLSTLLASLSSEGYAYQYLLRDLPAWNEALLAGAVALIAPTGILFVFHYLGLLKAPRSRWTLAFLAVTWLAALTMIVCALTGQRQALPLYQNWSLICTVVPVVLMAWRLWRGDRQNRVLFGALILFWLSVALRVGRNLAIAPVGVASEYSRHVGILMLLLVINFALSRRYQELRREKEAAQALALQIARDAERELEAKVASRTAELRNAVSQVEASLAAERRAQEEQRQFLATVSHELRTPVAVIDAAAQNLKLNPQQSDLRAQARYDKILRATGQLTGLLKGYLDESQFELLRNGSNSRPARLAPLLQDAAEAARLLSDRHPLTVDAAGLPDHFICDPDLTRLALRTLAENAAKYTPAGTPIVLRGQPADGGVTLEVIDHGPGIPADELPRVFERLFRGRGAAHTAGTGLGLPLARRMIEMQGGTLVIDSQPGTGCHCRIWLPG